MGHPSCAVFKIKFVEQVRFPRFARTNDCETHICQKQADVGHRFKITKHKVPFGFAQGGLSASDRCDPRL